MENKVKIHIYEASVLSGLLFAIKRKYVQYLLILFIRHSLYNFNTSKPEVQCTKGELFTECFKEKA
jgi:hypothetical protein